MRLFAKLILPLASLAMLAACSDTSDMPDLPKELTFNPDHGDSRTYRVITDTYAEAEGPFGPSSERVRSTMITKYEVEKSDDALAIHIIPSYLEMTFRNGHFRSSDAPELRDDEARALMRDGFKILLDDNRHVTDFIIHTDLGDYGSSQRDFLMDMFKDDFSRPGVVHGLKLEEGASVTVPAENDLPEVTFSIKRIHGEAAYVSVDGSHDKTKIFGLVVIDIHSGWIERGSIIASIQENIHGTDAHITSAMSMFPADWSFDIDLSYLADMSAAEMPKATGFDDVSRGITSERVFSSSEGYIEDFSDDMYLVLEHSGIAINDVGRIQFADARPYYIHGEPLELDLQLANAATFEFSAGSGATEVTTMAGILPLGWDNTHETLDNLGYVEVSAKWHPYTSERVQLNVRSDATSVSVGDATATLSPTDKDGIYQLLFEQGPYTHFDYQVGTSAPVYFEYKSYDDAPEWVGKGERRLLTITELGHYPGFYLLDFRDDKPRSIELMALTASSTPEDERTLRFYHPDAVDKSPRAAAPQRQMLYPTAEEEEMSQYGALNFEALEFRANRTDSIDFDPFSNTRLFLTLTPEQAALCQLEQDSEVFELRENHQPSGTRLYSNRLNNPVVFQALTEDGSRYHFYDEEVSVTLACPSEYRWQPLAYEPSAHPWLIDINELPGIDKDMPIRTLLRTFAFLPEQSAKLPESSDQVRARSLGVVLPSASGDSGHTSERHPYFHRSVADYLYEDTYLRVTGSVAHILQLKASDEIIHRELKHQFPSLPDTSTTFQQVRQSIKEQP